ncbi:hypothetical protein LCGC14_3050810, partial [marine sediment metagenome]
MSSVIAADADTGLGEGTGEPGATSEELGESASAYQKLQGENDKLKSQSEKLQGEFDAFKQVMAPKEQLYDTFEKNPQWVPVMTKAITDFEKGDTASFIPDEDFVPEEAYRPGTPSYKFREEQENVRIKKAVDTAMGGVREEMDAVREEQLVGQTQEQLVKSGMTQENAKGYMDFLRDPEKFPGGKELLLGPMAKAYT